ncbi:MAG: hypothetical protein JNN30_00900 [Rhodanobacteraceae bacterium]|nr:hypothetical protein [Rhodanobacteraceae bacterium]
MIRRLALLCPLLLTACDSPPAAVATAATSAPAAAATPHTANQLRMTLDGKVWQADRELFGAWHPPGTDRAVLMAGSLGPKDRHEQAFNLNLFGVSGPGRYVASGSTLSLKGLTSSAIQLANLSEQRYLVGGPFGYEVEVELLQAGSGVIEAKFHGRMSASDGTVLDLKDGYFLYRE